MAQNKCAALVEQQCSLPVELVYQYSASEEHLSESVRMAVVSVECISDTRLH